MPASSKASSGCSHSSLLMEALATRVPAPLWLPWGVLPMPATCQLCGYQPWLTARHVGLHSQSMADVSKHCAEMYPRPGHAADQRRHSSKYYNVAQLQNARQGNTGSANALFLVGKEKPNNVDLFKAKVWRKYHGNGHFTRYLSIPVALKNSVKVCSHSHSPQPSLAMQFDMYDTASQGHFLPKTKHHACFLGCHWADVTAPLQKQ